MRWSQRPSGTWATARSDGDEEDGGAVEGGVHHPSEPVGVDEGVQEVREEGQRDGAGEEVLPHADHATSGDRRHPSAADAALSRLDAILTPPPRTDIDQ